MVKVYGEECTKCGKYKNDKIPCAEYRFCYESLATHDKQIRADALSECLNIVRANGFQVSLIMIKGLLEQLNEHKN